MDALDKGRHEKTRRNCRNRFYTLLDDRNVNQGKLAFEELGSFIEQSGQNELLATMGQMEREFRFYERAAKSFQLHLDLNPTDVQVNQALGHSLLRWGDDLRRSAMKSNTHSTEADDRIKNAGTALENSIYSPADSQEKRWHNVRSCSMLVDVNCKLRDYERAKSFCESELELDADNDRLRQQTNWLSQRAEN